MPPPRVLAAEGCEVVAPETQPCCGALLVHAGEEAAAVELAKRTIEAFERADVETVVTNAAGCGSNVKEYGTCSGMIPSTPIEPDLLGKMQRHQRSIGRPRAARHTPSLKLRVAFHDSCHLQHAQVVRSQPRALLSSIPGLELAEIPRRHLLRLGGNLQLVQPDAANDAWGPQGGAHCSVDADVVATGNPGCVLQMQSALARQGQKTP